MVTEVSTKAPCKEPGNECEADDDENEEEADADNPGPRLGKCCKKYYITTANIIDINILKNWHHPFRIFEGFHVFHIQTSNSYLTSRFKTFEVTLYTSVNSCNVFYPNIRHM